MDAFREFDVPGAFLDPSLRVPQAPAVASRALAAVREAASATNRFERAAGVAFGLTRTQVRCLDVLCRWGPLKATVLARYVSVSRPAVAAAVGQLEGRGYVTRHGEAVDGRFVLVGPTAKARAVMASVCDVLDRAAVDQLVGSSAVAVAITAEIVPHLGAALRLAAHTIGRRPPAPDYRSDSTADISPTDR